MTGETAIIIPSAGRSKCVVTAISGAVLFVPEAEADDYRRHNPSTTIETHGTDDFKNLSEKRQAIYDRWGNVFMVDDDIAFVSRLNEVGNNRGTHLKPQEIHDLIQRTAATARAAGCYLYGFHSTPNLMHFHPHKPITLTNYINACAFGLHPSPFLYFSPRTVAAESHWINLLNAYTHRKSWSDTRYCFAQEPNSTFFKAGGQTAHRTLESEMRDTIFLRRMFGQAVKTRRTSGNGSKSHPYQRTIRNPL